jgi:hypothetical protein
MTHSNLQLLVEGADDDPAAAPAAAGSTEKQ